MYPENAEVDARVDKDADIVIIKPPPADDEEENLAWSDDEPERASAGIAHANPETDAALGQGTQAKEEPEISSHPHVNAVDGFEPPPPPPEHDIIHD